MAKFDGIWRPEPHPKREGQFLAVRYTDDLMEGQAREVATIGQVAFRKARSFNDEREAQTWCDAHNPVVTQKVDGNLRRAELLWLTRLANAEEGRMERSTSTTLLALEHRGYAASKPEPGRRQMDRWTITEEGRKALENEKD